MRCLLECLIWIGGVGYFDKCMGRVDVLYSSAKYNYVRLIQGPVQNGPDTVKFEIKISQQVEKKDCKAVSK